MYFLDSSHVLHVAKTGNDSNAGKAQQYPVNLASDAKLTIGSAISAAASGDTIILWPGDYAENVSFGAKALTMIGTSRNKSRVIPWTGDGVTMADDSVLCNLGVEALGSTAKGVNAQNKTNIVVRDCDIYANYDGFYGYGVKTVFLRDVRSRGKFDGGNMVNAEKVIAEGCIFEALGTSGAGNGCRALFGTGTGLYSNCVFVATRNDTSVQDIGAIYGGAASRVVLANCLLSAIAGSGHTGQAYGIKLGHTSAAVMVDNCVIYAESENAATGPYDLWQAYGKLVVSNCVYNTSDGDIVYRDAKADKAVKSLVNKVVQTKANNKIDVYDDDGSTIILTRTPTEDATKITLTPS